MSTNHFLRLALLLAILLLRARLSVSNRVLFACGTSSLSLSISPCDDRESASDLFPSASIPDTHLQWHQTSADHQNVRCLPSKPRPWCLPLLVPDPPNARSPHYGGDITQLAVLEFIGSRCSSVPMVVYAGSAPRHWRTVCPFLCGAPL